MLDRFFGYTEADREGFEAAVAAFIARVPELARALLQKINDERDNAKFRAASRLKLLNPAVSRRCLSAVYR